MPCHGGIVPDRLLLHLSDSMIEGRKKRQGPPCGRRCEGAGTSGPELQMRLDNQNLSWRAGELAQVMSGSWLRHRSLGPIITPTHQTPMHPILVHSFYTPSCVWYMLLNVGCPINIGGQSRDACEDNWHLRQSHRWTKTEDEGGRRRDFRTTTSGCQHCCLHGPIEGLILRPSLGFRFEWPIRPQTLSPFPG